MVQVRYTFTAKVMHCFDTSEHLHAVCQWEAIWSKVNYEIFDSLNGKVLEFTQVDTEVPYELYVEINQMALLFVVQEISDCNITKTMKMYKEKTDRKTIKVTKNLVDVIRAKTILLYPPMIR